MRYVILLLLATAFFACENSAKEETQQTEPQVAYKKEKVEERYPNGRLKLEGELLNGERNGIWTFYYENGMKWSEGKYRSGIRDGFSVVYYENGKKKLAGEYENDLRIGKWKVWNDDGSLAAEVNMDEKLSAADSLKLGLK
ncbi:MAG: hypothetical protein RIC95_15155 [Vicingaceae bacterium]